VIVGILLAAGAGSRFGGDKLLVPLPDGTPVGVRSARILRGAVDRAVAVVRASDAALARRLREEGLEVLPFSRAAEGMGASLAFGVAGAPEAVGFLVALADMPFVRPGTVAAVAGLLREGAVIAAPAAGGKRGHPVGFAAALRPQLEALEGDLGARSILDRHAGEVRLIEVDDRGIYLDIDTLVDVSEGAEPVGFE
jgi:molybdenum cofactor cytidylyltransferase